MRVNFTYEVIRRRWSHVTISDETNELMMPVWEVTANKSDLLRALTALLHGWETARCVWQAEEFGEFRWFFTRRGDLVDLCIAQMAGWEPTDQGGRTKYSMTCSLAQLAQKVHNEFHRLLYELGSEEYEQEWGEHFPRADLDALHSALEERKLQLRLNTKAPSKRRGHDKSTTE
jgi:hypothetical protein